MVGGNSASLTSLEETNEITRLRLYFTEGRDYSTQRTYWKGTVAPFLNWLHETQKVERSLTLGQPKLNRDMESEKPDPTRIPNPTELASIAGQMGVAHGAKWEFRTCCRILRASNLRSLRYSLRQFRS